MSATIVRSWYYGLSVVLNWMGKPFTIVGLLFHLASLWVLILTARIER